MATKALTIAVGADTSGMTAGLDKAQDAISKFYAKTSAKAESVKPPTKGAIDQIAKLGNSFKDLGSAGGSLKGLTGGLGGVAIAAGAAAVAMAPIIVAVGAVKALGKVFGMAFEGVERIDQLTDAAQQIGVTTESLSELRYAADLTGSSGEDLDAALLKLNQNLGDTSEEGGKAGEALKRLGLDSKDLAKLAPDEAFKQIVGGFEKVTSASDKTRIAMDVFGKGGVKILNTLSSGSKSLEDLSKEAREFGVSVSQLDAAKVGAAKDALDRAGAAVAGLGNQLAVKLAPYIEAAATLFADWFKQIGAGGKNVDLVMDNLAAGIAKVADFGVKMASVLLSALASVARGAKSVADLLGLDGGVLGQAADGLQKMADTLANAKPGQGLLSFYDELKKKAQDAAKAIADGVKASLDGAKSSDRLGDAIGDVVKKLKDQVATFGMTEGEIELDKLKQQGATDAQLAEVKALAAQRKALEDGKKALEDGKKAREELGNWAKGLAEKGKTPLEEYRDSIAKINKALKDGRINPEESRRATLSVQGEAADKVMSAEKGRHEVKFAGATEVNSREGYSAILKAMTGGGSNDLSKIAQRQLEAENRGNGLLTKILGAVTGPAPKPALFPI